MGHQRQQRVVALEPGRVAVCLASRVGWLAPVQQAYQVPPTQQERAQWGLRPEPVRLHRLALQEPFP